MGYPESREVADKLNDVQLDSAGVISEYGLTGQDELCGQVLDVFIDIYGAAASNAALYYYPVSCVYIAGGIAPKIKSRLIGERLISAFTRKGLMTINIQNVALKLIDYPSTGILGAIQYLKMNLQEPAD